MLGDRFGNQFVEGQCIAIDMTQAPRMLDGVVVTVNDTGLTSVNSPVPMKTLMIFVQLTVNVPMEVNAHPNIIIIPPPKDYALLKALGIEQGAGESKIVQ